ncbi:PH domain-containing protein [Clostridium thermarum]|uniref:PH domain-containing protein n=1 Tax=Clostridium thermarum TaxID=1716543 RepID=UPI001121F168|nr:PH domain-containing protein [Clostridium thermarum]
MILKPLRGMASIYMLLITLLTNAFMGVIFKLVNTYLLYVILIVMISMVNIYYLYYFIMSLTLSYKLKDNKLIISYFCNLRKVSLDLSKIKGYMKASGNIHGIKLSGVGNDKFSFGRNIIDKIGTTYMFVTSNNNILYLKTEEICYAISPEDDSEVKRILMECEIPDTIEEYVEKSKVELHKDKKFLIPFSIISILIVLMILIPFILYLKGYLPETMPLNFDESFRSLQQGTGKQFAFKQMAYGVLNMIILFCMYYAAYFCAKYDRKTAYRYLYISLAVTLVFFFLQLKILFTFGF